MMTLESGAWRSLRKRRATLPRFDLVTQFIVSSRSSSTHIHPASRLRLLDRVLLLHLAHSLGVARGRLIHLQCDTTGRLVATGFQFAATVDDLAGVWLVEALLLLRHDLNILGVVGAH